MRMDIVKSEAPMVVHCFPKPDRRSEYQTQSPVGELRARNSHDIHSTPLEWVKTGVQNPVITFLQMTLAGLGGKCITGMPDTDPENH